MSDGEDLRNKYSGQIKLNKIPCIVKHWLQVCLQVGAGVAPCAGQDRLPLLQVGGHGVLDQRREGEDEADPEVDADGLAHTTSPPAA